MRKASDITVGGDLLTAGAYVMNPSIFRHETARPPEPEPAVPVEVQPPAVTETAANTALAESAGGKDTPSETAKEPRPQAERVQGKQPSGSGKRAGAADPGSPLDSDMDFEGKTIFVGNIKVRGDGKVETGDSIIDERGVTPKSPPIPPIDLDSLPMRHMTPAQRRKILELRKKGLLPPARRTQPRQQQNKY